ncbi:branched-chain amino acid ABC transporter permease [Pigmentiphaga litoralis]|uniref:branched-chain amino acid ABC transporter permease n=1 Tax=Pigmentiphaga litoralis TaxID=516702 RepID=UPI00167666DD|nr:branched-chain amino acid ABC transporter permease [Pigmentiphaga litoralis]GGX00229.1 branched-chain amino acid ABC transporter permease [Pigmentiphaga litoralis]
MLVNLIGVFIDGLSYGAMLFVIAIGLSITLGLMGFVNLAHGAFAMFGGYFMVTLVGRYDWPFVPAIIAVTLAVALLSLLIERVVYAPFYRASQLDQSLLTFGVMLMAGGIAHYFWGPSQQAVRIPEVLTGRWTLGELSVSKYRAMLLGIGVALLVLLKVGLDSTRFGAMIRASVDNQRVAGGLGVPVRRVFMIAFAVGCGLAALGGALGAEVLGLDPAFAARYLVLCLLVVVVGGAGSINGTFFAAMLLGVADVASKYYVPQFGAFMIYVIMVLVLLYRPKGLYSLFARKG